MLKHFFTTLTAFTFSIAPALASDGPLTKSLIQKHLKQENQLLKGNTGKFSPKEVEDFLQKHLADGFSYNDTVQMSLGQFGASKQNLSYDRDQYIQDILNNIHNVKGANATISVKNVQIGSGGTKARVQYTTKAKMSAQDDQLSAMSGSGSAIDFDMKANSSCTSYMRWDDFLEVIQTEKLVCNTTASMEIPNNFNPFSN